jgi:TolA-binding protein
MFQAVFYFEADSLNKALNGDGNNLGFLSIIDDYGITDAGNLANYYAGVCYLKQGKFELARLYLEDFSSDDCSFRQGPTAWSVTHTWKKRITRMLLPIIRRRPTTNPNKYFSPAYLMKEALAYEKLNQNDKAKEAYEKIITQYWDSDEFQEAKKFKARLESNS